MAGKVSDTEARTGLADSLLAESFMLFLYGISIAVAGFVSEIIWWWMASVVSMASITQLRYSAT